jgi:hypothetical protein
METMLMETVAAVNAQFKVDGNVWADQVIQRALAINIVQIEQLLMPKKQFNVVLKYRKQLLFHISLHH